MATRVHAGPERAEEFMEALTMLPAEGWVSVGRAAAARRHTQAYRTAHLLMEALLADQRLAVPAWTIRDAVDTAAYYAGTCAPFTRDERRAFDRARDVCEAAALALLLGDALPATDAHELYAAAVVPLRDSAAARRGA